MKKGSIYIFIMVLIVFISLFTFASCSSLDRQATYLITAKGSASESGVIEYAGMTMNVYKDYASNPCGDCPDQPVSIYVGATAAETIKAMSEAITRADDVWVVEKCSDNQLLLKEKESGTAEKSKALSAPKGLTLTGKYN